MNIEIENLIKAGEEMASAWDAEGYPRMREEWDAALEKFRSVTVQPEVQETQR